MSTSASGSTTEKMCDCDGSGLFCVKNDDPESQFVC